VKSEDEALVRRAEQLIHHKFNEFQLRFSGQEKLDYLAMSALMNVVELMKNEHDSAGLTDEIKARLSEASQLIAEGLRKG
jgi:hypothetical protein